MKHIPFIAFLVLLLSCRDNEVIEKNDNASNLVYRPNTEASANTDTVLELQVKLIDKLDTLKSFPYCGIFATQVVLRFEVLKVLKGPYEKKDILIKILCPQEAIEQNHLKNNKVYNYRLRRCYATAIQIGKPNRKTPQDFFEIL